MAGNTSGSPYKITVGLINVGENATTYIDEIQKDLNTISKSLTISPSVKWDEIKRLRSELNGLDKTQVVTLKINDDEIITSLNNISKKLVDTFSKSFNAQTTNAGIQRIAAAIATAEKSTKDLSRAAELAESSLEAIGDVANADAARNINKLSRSLGKLSDNLKSWSSDTDFMGGINDSLKNVESTVLRISKAFTDNAILVPTKIDIDKSRENFVNQRVALTRSLKATGFAVDVAINPTNLAKIKDGDDIADIELTGSLDSTQTKNRVNTVISALNADKSAFTDIKLVVNQDIIRDTLKNAMEFNNDEFKVKVRGIVSELQSISNELSNIPKLKDVLALPKDISKNKKGTEGTSKSSASPSKTIFDETQLKSFNNRLDLIAVGLNTIAAGINKLDILEEVFRDSNGELLKFSNYLNTIILQMGELMQDSVKASQIFRNINKEVGNIKTVSTAPSSNVKSNESGKYTSSRHNSSDISKYKVDTSKIISDDTKQIITSIYKLVSEYERLIQVKKQAQGISGINSKEYINAEREADAVKRQIDLRLKSDKLNKNTKERFRERIRQAETDSSTQHELSEIKALINEYEHLSEAKASSYATRESDGHYYALEKETGELEKQINQSIKLSALNDDIKTSLKERVVASKEAAASAEKIAKAEQALNLKETEAKTKYGGYMEIQSDRVRYTDDFKLLKENYKRYISLIQSAKAAVSVGDFDKYEQIPNDIRLAEKALKQYKGELKNVASSQTILAKEADKINEVWRKVAESVDEYGNKLRRVDPAAYDKLITLNRRLSNGNIGLNDAKKQFAELQMSIRRAGLEADNFWRKLAKTATTRLRSNIAGEGWFMMAAAMKDVYRNVVDLDAAMTELKKVTEGTRATYAQFLDDAQVRAQNLGATLVDVVSASADFARLGYSIPDASNLADTAITYLNVGDDVDSIDQASKSIISTMQGFNIEAEKSMGIVDRFNEVANHFASSAGDIGEITQRSAAAMKVAGSDLDETIALGVTANEVVQNAETVGTALKTMSMRLRSSKTEMEEAGLDTDGMAESVSKLRDEIKSLSGVDIMLDEDTFKSPYKMLTELGKVWDNLTDVSRANIGELLFGKRQANYCPIVQKCA